MWKQYRCAHLKEIDGHVTASWDFHPFQRLAFAVGGFAHSTLSPVLPGTPNYADVSSRVPFVDIAGQQFLIAPCHNVPGARRPIGCRIIDVSTAQCCSRLGISSPNPQTFCGLRTVLFFGCLKRTERVLSLV